MSLSSFRFHHRLHNKSYFSRRSSHRRKLGISINLKYDKKRDVFIQRGARAVPNHSTINPNGLRILSTYSMQTFSRWNRNFKAQIHSALKFASTFRNKKKKREYLLPRAWKFTWITRFARQINAAFNVIVKARTSVARRADRAIYNS